MSAAPETTVTAVEAELRRRRRWSLPLLLVLLAVLGVGTIAVLGGLVAARFYFTTGTPRFEDPLEHFKYGSIGAEPGSGIPYNVWMTLPTLFPDEFAGRNDYSAFGFLYEAQDGGQRDLPIGISRRTVHGVDLVWFNCAVCHTGTWRAGANGPRNIVAGMPANNLELHRFIQFILSIGTDERLAPSRLVEAMEKAGYRLGPVESLVWRFVVMPQMREGLIAQRSRLAPLLAVQPEWGPGRVDTFNPYKLGQMALSLADIPPAARVGTVDFPSIFMQGPREGMQLHWDGNNSSLAERNLSAALGAGVTPETVGHMEIGRIADWLKALPPPEQPVVVASVARERGERIYARTCAGCHGMATTDGYRFEGDRLGKVDPITAIGTDRARLDSYTEEFRQLQLTRLFSGTRYQFKKFIKTDGYANMPLDGLWLRGPYLHNGSVPTLEALLMLPAERPVRFARGSDLLDTARGGFMSPECSVNDERETFCFDTALPGNGNGGHLYGTELTVADKIDLLEYLKRF